MTAHTRMASPRAFLSLLAILAMVCFLSSCATAPARPPEPVSRGPVARQDTTHVVGPGETFWRISKMYDVPMASILSANNLSQSSVLEMGQRLRIPNAAEDIQPVVTLYPSKKWKYIIIHHSATGDGSSLAFHKAHKAKGWDMVGYHFVIDNGTGGKQDGQIEATPRWIKQLDGAHCKASDMNMKGIGICLVGNFNEDRVSRKQMESLTYLVNRLRKHYKISTKNIIRHGHVAGSATDCPGKQFPWGDFTSRLK